MIVDKQIFESFERRLTSAVRTESRLPQQVFRRDYGRYAFVEFDLFSGAKFWSLLQRLAISCGDTFIATVAVEPDPVDYSHREFGVYGAIQVDASAPHDDYFAELSTHPDGWPVDSLLHNSYVLAWLSCSAQWVIWGERESELAVIGLKDSLEIELQTIAGDAGVHLFPIDDALRLASTAFRNGVVLDTWQSEFRRNYSSTISG